MRLNNNSDRYFFLCTVELDTECTPNVPNSSSITSVVAAAPVSMSSRQNLSFSDYLHELTAATTDITSPVLADTPLSVS